jgi:hypothetical protein
MRGERGSLDDEPAVIAGRGQRKKTGTPKRRQSR